MNIDQNKVAAAKEVLLLSFLSGATPQDTMASLLDQGRYTVEELRAAAMEMLAELDSDLL